MGYLEVTDQAATSTLSLSKFQKFICSLFRIPFPYHYDYEIAIEDRRGYLRIHDVIILGVWGFKFIVTTRSTENVICKNLEPIHQHINFQGSQGVKVIAHCRTEDKSKTYL